MSTSLVGANRALGRSLFLPGSGWTAQGCAELDVPDLAKSSRAQTSQESTRPLAPPPPCMVDEKSCVCKVSLCIHKWALTSLPCTRVQQQLFHDAGPFLADTSVQWGSVPRPPVALRLKNEVFLRTSGRGPMVCTHTSTPCRGSASVDLVGVRVPQLSRWEGLH